ncbi:hypothetical protein [Streptomyces sp. NPDC002078]
MEPARALRDLPHPQAVAAYEHARRARVERVIAQAARTGSGKMAWQYDHQIHWEAAVAA